MEYAQEYSKKEKAVRILAGVFVGSVIYFLHTIWLIPIINDVVSRPHCFEWLGFNLADYFWYLVMVGVPLFAFTMSWILIPRGIAGIRERRFPPKAVKVYRPTKVKTGFLAWLISAMHLLIPFVFLILAAWGYLQAAHFPTFNKQALDLNLCIKDSTH